MDTYVARHGVRKRSAPGLPCNNAGGGGPTPVASPPEKTEVTSLAQKYRQTPCTRMTIPTWRPDNIVKAMSQSVRRRTVSLSPLNGRLLYPSEDRSSFSLKDQQVMARRTKRVDQFTAASGD